MLNEQAKLKEAEEVFQQALSIQNGLAAGNPGTEEYRTDLARSHNSLGILLSDLGRFPEAQVEFGRAQELGLAAANDALKQSVREQTLAARLPAIANETAKPKDITESLELASLCQKPWQNRFVTAARLYAQAFAQDGKLADDMQQQYRYTAACAAVRAGTGQGEEAAKLGELEKTQLRRNALAWLTSDLAYWSKLATSKQPGEKALAQINLQRWQHDADLAAVRGPAIDKLPVGEQAGWRQLWLDDTAALSKLR